MNLRLLMIEECNRSCAGCCNNDFDLKNLPVAESFEGYDKIMLTGGEPMLNQDLLKDTIKRIREETDAPIILYTAKSKRQQDLIEIMKLVDGVTLTLHEQYDLAPFIVLNVWMKKAGITGKSLRLNVFSNVNIGSYAVDRGWQVQDNMVWVADCPLPKNEVFMRL